MYAYYSRKKPHEAYQDARNKAYESLLMRRMMGKRVNPPNLKEILENYSHYFEPNVKFEGFINPKRIVGTTEKGRESDFASNFLPLVNPRRKGDFASKWMKVYENLGKWNENPIQAFEFLHNIYVMEGNKRTSVARYVNLGVINSKIVRIIPEKSNGDLETEMYHEFLDFEKRSGVSDVWFSEKGKFDELEELIDGYAPICQDSYGCKYSFFKKMILEPFSALYNNMWVKTNGFTKGDILLEYLKMYPELNPAYKKRKQDIRQAVKNKKNQENNGKSWKAAVPKMDVLIKNLIRPRV